MVRKKNISMCLCTFISFTFLSLSLSGLVLPRAGCQRGEEEEVETESNHRPTRHCGLWRWSTHTRTHTYRNMLCPQSHTQFKLCQQQGERSELKSCQVTGSMCHLLVVSLVYSVTLCNHDAALCLCPGSWPKRLLWLHSECTYPYPKMLI